MSLREFLAHECRRGQDWNITPMIKIFAGSILSSHSTIKARAEFILKVCEGPCDVNIIIRGCSHRLSENVRWLQLSSHNATTSREAEGNINRTTLCPYCPNCPPLSAGVWYLDSSDPAHIKSEPPLTKMSHFNVIKYTCAFLTVTSPKYCCEKADWAHLFYYLIYSVSCKHQILLWLIKQWLFVSLKTNKQTNKQKNKSGEPKNKWFWWPGIKKNIHDPSFLRVYVAKKESFFSPLFKRF